MFTVRQQVRNTDVTRRRGCGSTRSPVTCSSPPRTTCRRGLGRALRRLLRKITVTVREFPRLGRRVELHTFCSGTGPRWAERTTTVAGPDGELAQSTAVWAAVSRTDGRPVPLGPEFHRLYGAAAQGRSASVRLSHPRPPASPAAGPGRCGPATSTRPAT